MILLASYAAADLSSPAAIPITLPSDEATIRQIAIYIGSAMDGGDATFNFYLNAATPLATGSGRWIFTDGGSAFFVKSGMSQAMVRGDYLTILLDAITGGTVTGPILVIVDYTPVEKTVPVNGDGFELADSEDGYTSKWLTFANFKAALKGYFDTLYGNINGSISQAPGSQTISSGYAVYIPDQYEIFTGSSLTLAGTMEIG